MYDLLDTMNGKTVVDSFPTWRRAFNASNRLEPFQSIRVQGYASWRYQIAKRAGA